MNVHLFYKKQLKYIEKDLEYTAVFQQVDTLIKILNWKGFGSQCSALLLANVYRHTQGHTCSLLLGVNHISYSVYTQVPSGKAHIAISMYA